MLGAIYTVNIWVKLDMDDMIGPVLPIQMARSAAGGAVGVGRGQFIFQLAEQVGLVEFFRPEVWTLWHWGE